MLEKTLVPYSIGCVGRTCVLFVKLVFENALLPILVSFVRTDKLPAIEIFGVLLNTFAPISVINPVFAGSALSVYVSFRSARLKAVADGGA